MELTQSDQLMDENKLFSFLSCCRWHPCEPYCIGLRSSPFILSKADLEHMMIEHRHLQPIFTLFKGCTSSEVRRTGSLISASGPPQVHPVSAFGRTLGPTPISGQYPRLMSDSTHTN
jgi:hypothetical protein